jgi:hypothetical protein
MKWMRERKMKTVSERVDDLEAWLLLILRVSDVEWVAIEKIMMIVFLLDRVFGPKTHFMRGEIPWSKCVECKLEELMSRGFVESKDSMYRITERGKMEVEKYPLNEPRFRYTLLDIKFFLPWSEKSLKEYIKINYPEWF